MNLCPRWEISRDENHAYTVATKDGPVTLPGTTGILEIVGSKDRQNALMGWAKKNCLLKVAEHIRAFSGQQLTVDEAWIEAVRKSAWKRDKEKLKEAGDIGTAVHKAIDEHISGRVPVLTEQTEQGFKNFLRWQEETGVKIIAGDTFVASLYYGYGGAMDAIGEINGEMVAFDWKTSNGIRDEYALQAAAYSMAAEETFNIIIPRAFVVRFGKDKPEVEAREIDMAESRNAFKVALALYKKMKAPLWRTA